MAVIKVLKVDRVIPVALGETGGLTVQQAIEGAGINWVDFMIVDEHGRPISGDVPVSEDDELFVMPDDIEQSGEGDQDTGGEDDNDDEVDPNTDGGAA